MKINLWNMHASEVELALYGAGDGKRWRAPWVWVHVSGCERCRERARVYSEDHEYLRYAAQVLPSGLNWERMASEMAANIRVGLAAGECVTPKTSRMKLGWGGLGHGWRVAAAAGVTALLLSAWWLHLQAPRGEVLSRAWQAVARAPFSTAGISPWGDARPRVQASSQGIELLEGGSSRDGSVMILSSGSVSQGDARPVAVSLSVQGSARAHYVDADTGQVTITSVYAE